MFGPARLGPVRLRNRIIKAATFEGRTPRGVVTDELIEFHRAVAAGGAAMTTVAYCAVAPEGRTERRQIVMGPDVVPGLRRLTDAVHREGAAASAQLGHAGPVSDSSSTGNAALAPSWRLNPMSMRITRAATEDDLRRIVRVHADAAWTAVESGFDAVELHFGHNYLISSFLSPRFNRRRDEWNGSTEKRARLARDVARAVRERVGDRIAVLAKFGMDDGVRGGLRPEESLTVARLLQADGALDALELTCGSSLGNPMYLFRGDVPVREFAGAFRQPLRAGIRLFGRAVLHEYLYEDAYLLPEARKFRAALTMPLVLLGGVTSRRVMDHAMVEGFDFVAMGRALLMEPDLPNRLRTEPMARSACTHCNKCMPTIYTGTRCVLAAHTS
ncbi:NADH:flavin oxidoreductase [Pseudonocardia spinosispora]|uniref:NADH:flavin oxidoreductase n=1 Tax=Pseudonocardia spinosispora TaxID=103441 RepID=UPI003CCBA843